MRKNRRVGFTCSTFSLLHAGHIMMLRVAKDVCDYLIVGLQSDPTIDRPEKNKPVESLVERQMRLQGCRYVDEIIVYDTESDLVDILQSYPIDVRILGEEYRHKDFTGRDECKARGIELHFNKRNHRFSSSDLVRRIIEQG